MTPLSVVRIQIGGGDPFVEIDGRRLHGVKNVSVTPRKPIGEFCNAFEVTVTFDAVNHFGPDGRDPSYPAPTRKE